MIKTVYISAVTNKVNIEQSDLWMQHWCEHYKIEEALVRAFREQESHNGKSRERFEPHLMDKTNKATKWYRDILSIIEQEDPYSYYSLGDMQILYGIAKLEGYHGNPLGLMHPKWNYKYAIKHIKALCISQKWLDYMISSYNQGMVSYMRKGKQKVFKSKYTDKNKNGLKDMYEDWKNQFYVNRVMKKYYKYGGKILLPRYKKYYKGAEK